MSVVMPALDEEETVGAAVASVLPLTDGPVPLVDELIVMDSGSTDRTVERAAEAGARVVPATDVLPELPPITGKGEVMWRSLAVTTGDIVCYVDSDIIGDSSNTVCALLGPLLIDRSIGLVKGFSDAARSEIGQVDIGGGPLTELLTRPLLAALRPDLTTVIRPLTGQFAATRALLESVPFAVGYGVDIGLLLDAHAALGLDGLAQASVGSWKNRPRPVEHHQAMSHQILAAVLRRSGISAGDGAFLRFVKGHDGAWASRSSQVEIIDRPPMCQVERRGAVQADLMWSGAPCQTVDAVLR